MLNRLTSEQKLIYLTTSPILLAPGSGPAYHVRAMKHRGRMLGVFREKRFSPRRVKEDAAILRLTAEGLRRDGFRVRLVQPREMAQSASAGFTFAMCEGPRYLRILEKWEALGYPVFNRPMATRNCHRWRMLRLVAGTGVRIPRFLLIETSKEVRAPFDYEKGVWVKRWDLQSTRRDDVRVFHSRASLNRAVRELRARDIKLAILQEHIPGDHIKLYGVRGSGWFHCLRTGPEEAAEGHNVSPGQIHVAGEEAAARLGLDIYGADLVVTGQKHYLIDINSWPSFAPCREEAAGQIASFLASRYDRAGLRP